ELREELFNRQGGEGVLAFESLIEIGDVGVVMLAVVDLHGHLVDVGFERIGRIRKWWKNVGHRTLLFSSRLLSHSFSFRRLQIPWECAPGKQSARAGNVPDKIWKPCRATPSGAEARLEARHCSPGDGVAQPGGFSR